tara:strand:- start:13130 stop:14419 length:1290 start_codon:yes stop_codon:yes gene_type:complete
MAIKQSRGITIGKGTPQRLEGQNGDMTIRSSRKGLKLYVKESNKWHSLDLGIDLRQIASTVRKLEDEVKRLSTKTNNTPVVDKILLREAGGTSAVAVQNKKGAVSFRSSTDGADAPVDIAKTGTVSGGGTLTEGMALTVAAATHSRFTSVTTNALLSISGTATDVGDIAIGWLNGATRRWLAGFIANDTSKFYISSGTSLASPEVTIVNDGKVGIGTTSPDSKLHISYSDNSPEGDIDNNFNDVGLQIENTHADGVASIQLRSNDADGYIFYDKTGSNAGDMHFRTDGMDSLSVLTLKDDGKVGIGTESPTTTLDVEGTVSYKHTAFTTAGPTDNVDVSDTTVLEVDTSGGNVVIGGFTGGVQGQILHIVKTNTANFIQLEHNETAGNQNIYLTSGSDERVVGYGGYTLYCNGLHWFSLSNPTGAADGG